LSIRLQVVPIQLDQIDKANLSPDCAKLSKYLLKMESESGLRNCVLQIQERMDDNAQNVTGYTHFQCVLSDRCPFDR
jgi:hypothetical protein